MTSQERELWKAIGALLDMVGNLSAVQIKIVDTLEGMTDTMLVTANADLLNEARLAMVEANLPSPEEGS